MQFFSMNYLITMRYLPQVDREIVAVAVAVGAAAFATAAAVFWLVT